MSRLQYMNLKLVFRQILTAGESRVQICLSVSTRYYSKLSNWGTKKAATHVKITNYHPEAMADPQIEQILAPLREAVKKQVSNRLIHRFFYKNINKLIHRCLRFYLLLVGCRGKIIEGIKCLGYGSEKGSWRVESIKKTIR